MSVQCTWDTHPAGSKRMQSPSLWLGISGGMLMVLLMAKGFRGAIIMAVLFVTFVSWIPGHGASYLGEASQIPCECCCQYNILISASSCECCTYTCYELARWAQHAAGRMRRCNNHTLCILLLRQHRLERSCLLHTFALAAARCVTEMSSCTMTVSIYQTSSGTHFSSSPHLQMVLTALHTSSRWSHCLTLA